MSEPKTCSHCREQIIFGKAGPWIHVRTMLIGCEGVAAAPAEVALIIPTCDACPFRDHSGAFTPGGAKDICSHPKAVDSFAPEPLGPSSEPGFQGDDRYHWRHRMIDAQAVPPSQCPIRKTT